MDGTAAIITFDLEEHEYKIILTSFEKLPSCIFHIHSFAFSIFTASIYRNTNNTELFPGGLNQNKRFVTSRSQGESHVTNTTLRQTDITNTITKYSRTLCIRHCVRECVSADTSRRERFQNGLKINNHLTF